MPYTLTVAIGRTVTTDKLGHILKFAFVDHQSLETMALLVMMENEIQAYVSHH